MTVTAFDYLLLSEKYYIFVFFSCWESSFSFALNNTQLLIKINAFVLIDKQNAGKR